VTSDKNGRHGILKAMLAKMNARMDATQEKIDASTKEMQTKMEDTMESQISFLVSRMEPARKTNQEEIKAAIQSIWSEGDGMIQHRVENIRTCANHKAQSLQKACQESEAYTEKIQPDTIMMQSVSEYQEVPKEEDAVMLVGGLRRRHGDWSLARGCRQKPKGRIQASCDSRKRLTFVGRRVIHCAGEASSERTAPEPRLSKQPRV
jgi:hypothetical protein